MRRLRWAGWSLYAAALVLVAFRNRDHGLNADGVAYLRLAGYYAEGRFGLAAAPYWGPLLAWLGAPFLAAGVAPLLAGRLVMAGTALLFTAGAAAVLEALDLRRWERLAGTIIAALYALLRSIELISPDILLGGCLAFCLAHLLRMPRARCMVRAALWGAAAGLAKPVGIPLVLLSALGIGLLHVATGTLRVKGAIARGLAFLAVLGAVWAPWAGWLVHEEGWDSLGRNARVNYILAGRRHGPRPEHPQGRIPQFPAPGRVTVWENPTGKGYLSRPLSHHRLRQLRSLDRNSRGILFALLDFDLFHLGLFAALAAFLFHRPWRAGMAQDRWRWAALPVLACVVVYLPFISDSHRYAFPAYIFVLGGALGLAKGLGWRWLQILLVVSFADHPVMNLPDAFAGLRSENVVAARRLAARMRSRDLGGSIAGDHIASLYVAFFGAHPWHGTAGREADAARLRDFQSRFVVVTRGGPAERSLLEAKDFEPLMGAGHLRLFRRLPRELPSPR